MSQVWNRLLILPTAVKCLHPHPHACWHPCMQCGLDKAHGGADMATQEAAFRDQLVLGQEMKRPISVGVSPHRSTAGVSLFQTDRPTLERAQWRMLASTSVVQVHCVRAFGKLLEIIQVTAYFTAAQSIG